jgi:nitrile hydratase accessory protein
LSPPEPVFVEPWHARAFVLANKLIEMGHFTLAEWTDALGLELRATVRGEVDAGSRYYHHWVAALEKLVTTKGLIDTTSLHARKAAWEAAYRRTPHGKPVELT